MIQQKLNLNYPIQKYMNYPILKQPSICTYSFHSPCCIMIRFAMKKQNLHSLTTEELGTVKSLSGRWWMLAQLENGLVWYHRTWTCVNSKYQSAVLYTYLYSSLHFT